MSAPMIWPPRSPVGMLIGGNYSPLGAGSQSATVGVRLRLAPNVSVKSGGPLLHSRPARRRAAAFWGTPFHARAFVGPMTASERYAELAEYYGRTKLQARDDYSRHLLQSLEETYRGLAEGAALLERSSQVPTKPEKPA